jgi:CRP/FNR family transcriptional regulator, cyclic AMP receptor protein
MGEAPAGNVFDGRYRETAVVLEHDRELAEVVPADRRALALAASVAGVLRVARGEWDARPPAERTRGGYGFLVLDGLLVRRAGIDARVAAELLGPGDLLRPLEHDGEQATLPFAATWRVLEPLALAVLDRRWTARAAPYPELGVALAGRALRRSRRLANMFVIGSYPHLDERLLLVLWEMADRYGRVRRDGVHVPLRVTHQTLSELAAARRPSVSAALGRLTATGAVRRVDDGWLLSGEPPLHARGQALEADDDERPMAPR